MSGSSFIDVNVINPMTVDFPAGALDTNATIVGTPNVAVTNTPSVNATIVGNVTQATNNFSYDPSGRLRVGSLTTLLDGKILNADNALLFETVGTGTGTFTNNKFNMAVTAVQVIGMEVVNGATTDSGILMLILNPTISAPITYAANSLIEEGTPTNQTITAGTGRVMAAIAVGSSAAGTQIMKDNFLAYLGGTIANVFDQIVLAYMPTTTNQTIKGVLTIKEY